MPRTPPRHRGPGPDDDWLVPAWERALEERGFDVAWDATLAPRAWSVDALSLRHEVVANATGETQAEALEVLVWNLFGRDPLADDSSS